MNSKRRKPRPLKRDQQQYRDDRLYVVACDDRYAPSQYFSAYRKHFLGARLHVVVIPTEDGTSSAEHVLNRLLDYNIETGDQRWMLLDTDHYIKGTHRKSFMKALSRAGKEGIRVALSRPCFELWLLLHHVNNNDRKFNQITNAKDACSLLDSILGNYNKCRLQMEHFPLSSIPQAVLSASLLDSAVKGGSIPDGNTTRVFQLWQEVVRNASLAQLPDELQELKAKLA
ncbi:RloB family protein [Ruficoccus sp. ZRK36]|uniref:RloB family protein n=1 Tax=Ruficoccus sp. ZRK36 TaxID=2866311 RepID=UPI001C738B6E|nr:RloB family protein [Ruficoccus sp. ZRK36]QYY35260.1 RloB family protein [Ruficoccus sp. ZRK36]